MTSAVAPRAGLPGTRTDTSYTPPADLTFDEWCGVMGTLQAMDRSVKWWLGDALLFGEAKFSHDAYQAFPDAFTGSVYAESTLRAAAWVSDHFPRGTRVEQLTWTHHRVVAELPPVEARRLLMAALAPVAEGDPPLSTRALIELRDKHKEQLRGRAVTADGQCAADAEESLIWHPTEDDLTDEARSALEAHAPGGRHRLGYVSGFLRALIWADQQDAFKEWRL